MTTGVKVGKNRISKLYNFHPLSGLNYVSCTRFSKHSDNFGIKNGDFLADIGRFVNPGTSKRSLIIHLSRSKIKDFEKIAIKKGSCKAIILRQKLTFNIQKLFLRHNSNRIFRKTADFFSMV